MPSASSRSWRSSALRHTRSARPLTVGYPCCLTFAGERSPPLHAGEGDGCRRCTGALAPARVLAEDTQRRLADDLVDQHRVGRVDRAGADVAVQPLELVALEEAGPAADVERSVH